MVLNEPVLQFTLLETGCLRPRCSCNAASESYIMVKARANLDGTISSKVTNEDMLHDAVLCLTDASIQTCLMELLPPAAVHNNNLQPSYTPRDAIYLPTLHRDTTHRKQFYNNAKQSRTTLSNAQQRVTMKNNTCIMHNNEIQCITTHSNNA